MFIRFLSFSLSEKSQATFWWLWISLNTCHWRTCASFVGPNSMKSDMLWRYFLTTERMGTLDSGNSAWRTWQVSETRKCYWFFARKSTSLLNICPSALSHWDSGNTRGAARSWRLCVVWRARWYSISFLFWVTAVLVIVQIKGCLWNSCQERTQCRNACWKSRWAFFLSLENTNVSISLGSLAVPCVLLQVRRCFLPS